VVRDNLLYYGDNLDVLRRHVDDESVDLVYLDPPFKSDQDYNAFFEERDGTRSASQIKAFEDTWEWNEAAEKAYVEVVENGPTRVSQAMQAFRSLLGQNDMMAYLAMMAPRLVELRRVMKETGSIYLHCDSAAGAHLRLLMDAVFLPENFRDEIVWRRHNARSTDARWPRIHDTLLFYSKGERFYFSAVRVAAEADRMPHTLIKVGDDKYQTYELTGPGIRREGDSGKPWRGFDPGTLGRHWANSHATMNDWDAAGLIHWPKKPGKAGGFPRRIGDKPFQVASRVVMVGDVWTDIDRINQSAKERLGYPTQKPEALLERIIMASSREEGTVLDPFCGCGTAIAVSQKLDRRWIGIDITHLAITLIKNRLRSTFGKGVLKKFKVIGEPVSLPDAEALARQDRYQFQWWALGLVGARPAPTEQKKGADKGIDGRLYFHDEPKGGKTKQVVLSVKSGGTSVKDVRDLAHVVDREKAAIGCLSRWSIQPGR
jgi:site-specific DNA-methyltransferase (adenine-specific)